MVMATSPLPLKFPSPQPRHPCSEPLCFFAPTPYSLIASFRVPPRLRVSFSQQTIQLDTETSHTKKKQRRKPRPSFLEQVQDKWSVKTTSVREKLPWQEQEQAKTEETEETHQEVECEPSGSEKGSLPSGSVGYGTLNKVILAPWAHGGNPGKSMFDSDAKISHKIWDKSKNVDGSIRDDSFFSVGQEAKFDEAEGDGLDDISSNSVSDTDKVGIFDEDFSNAGEGLEITDGSSDSSESKGLLLEGTSDEKCVERGRFSKRNAEMAERLIPEPELKRLRNLALRTVARIKVRAAGVTQVLVDSIHEKWKEDEVVKLKFEGPPSKNMKRIHEILESRTGGLVIWRSGSSVVLYRGMSYKLQCVQSYAKHDHIELKKPESPRDSVDDVNQSTEVKKDNAIRESAKIGSVSWNNMSEDELMDSSELNIMLDELGPRFEDWSGREPLPVDADLLPAVVPGYKPPFRRLPYGMKQSLRNKEMTYFRQAARSMPPHFALGRNRELQGLATAMVKLWERSALAKIAIKRGVPNTRNERMAEELKLLTGGTLLSRNKDYIVFYRGNDFLPPGVKEALSRAENRATLHQDDEEQAREKAAAFIDTKAKSARQPLVAGTLSETKAATSRWANGYNSEDLEKMMREAAVARHASLVKFLEKKLALAKGKIKKAEKTLRKVQEDLEPSELPYDLETLTDEERFLFRKIGLSMKPFLLLGRRGIFDGTVENMHLHWKYRELVKIIVERKSFQQVRHVAISLEAESGGVLVSVDKTTKGYAIIVYRGKNYQRPTTFRPKNLLTKRQALARSIELQRREALQHHVTELQDKIEKMKNELENMKAVTEIDEETLYSWVDNASEDDEDLEEDGGEEA